MQLATTPNMDVVHKAERIEDPRMAEIKTRVAEGYEVDAELVAQEMLRKAQLVKLARQLLVSAPGHNHVRPARGL
jgi:hypothetical protein